MNGDPAQRFSEVYGALYGRVRAYAARRVGADAADEVAAETFTIAWRRFDALPAEPLPWLYGVALWEAWHRLREADREVLALVAWEELSVAEAAQVLGCPAPVFSVRLHRRAGASSGCWRSLPGAPARSRPYRRHHDHSAA